jgi:hypothetical protein
MKITKAEVDLMNNICMLLEQHGAWTRMAIMSMVLGLPDEDLVINLIILELAKFQIVPNE